MQNDVVKKLTPVMEEIVSAQGLKLYDLEYVKEDGNYFLRVAIEKEDGTMDFETAEVISNLVSAKLDELDPIEHEYILDVCSPGAERPLKSKEEIMASVGCYVTIHLSCEDANKKDSYTGTIIEALEDSLVLSYKDKTRVKKIAISWNNIAKANLAIKF